MLVIGVVYARLNFHRKLNTLTVPGWMLAGGTDRYVSDANLTTLRKLRGGSNHSIWLLRTEGAFHLPKAVLVLTFLEYPIGCRIAQYRSTETATKQKIEMVHNTTNKDTVNRQAYRFDGNPTDAMMANGIPNSPTRKSAAANDTM
ncbi:hypothetical protein QE152_g26803 [Popillia japonica]|uniref:Uncharacterized protein n=1 Tax=Popillia japonica TaxID=7064 RepID=A0AAW1JY60_POPJA